METIPLDGAFGAELRGLDLSQGVDPALAEKLHALPLEHRLLVLRVVIEGDRPV